MERRSICGKCRTEDENLPFVLRRIGGPRYVCIKDKGHTDLCDFSTYMVQAQHADATSRGYRDFGRELAEQCSEAVRREEIKKCFG